MVKSCAHMAHHEFKGSFAIVLDFLLKLKAGAIYFILEKFEYQVRVVSGVRSKNCNN